MQHSAIYQEKLQTPVIRQTIVVGSSQTTSAQLEGRFEPATAEGLARERTIHSAMSAWTVHISISLMMKV